MHVKLCKLPDYNNFIRDYGSLVYLKWYSNSEWGFQHSNSEFIGMSLYNMCNIKRKINANRKEQVQAMMTLKSKKITPIFINHHHDYQCCYWLPVLDKQKIAA